MTFPRLNEPDRKRLSREVADYIAGQRLAFRGQAAPLDAEARGAMKSFFEVSALDPVRVLVLSGSSLPNPPFYRDLVRLGFAPEMLPNFTRMAAVTLVDTIVAQEAFTETLLFHELVHVVQFAKLGLEEFAGLYVDGFLSGGSYREIPLERNAYELEARFAGAPTEAFSVAVEVQEWIDDGRFGPAFETRWAR